ALQQIRSAPGFAGDVTELAFLSKPETIFAPHERAIRSSGSAYTGVFPVVVTPAYTVASWPSADASAARAGHWELELSTAFFSESLGEPSRLAISRNMAFEVL